MDSSAFLKALLSLVVAACSILIGVVLTIFLVGFLNYAQNLLVRNPMITTETHASSDEPIDEIAVSHLSGECSCLKGQPFWGMAVEVIGSRWIHHYAHRQTDCDCGKLAQEPPARKASSFSF